MDNIYYKKKIYKEEAKFFYSLIKLSIKKKDVILDLGAGPGFLTSLLISKGFKNVIGIDKISSGFKENKIIQKKFSKNIKMNKNFHFKSIQSLRSKKKFDVIILFSVIEHVKNWKRLLLHCLSRLNKGGKIIINCPNYLTFYEPHFSIPIIINKEITYLCFKKYISNFEKKNNYNGMYRELNFININQIISFVKRKKLDFNLNNKILEKYFLRTLMDKEFNKRHSNLTIIVKFLIKIGVHKLLKFIPKQFQPIIHLEIKKN
ncbi:class I SAM-dependent methyltransferase [Candidatus Pelagibacter sp.]|nr:class I SAM-dependent methyltransferase [Candidatus Pelagibacter sp.]